MECSNRLAREEMPPLMGRRIKPIFAYQISSGSVIIIAPSPESLHAAGLWHRSPVPTSAAERSSRARPIRQYLVFLIDYQSLPDSRFLFHSLYYNSIIYIYHKLHIHMYLYHGLLIIINGHARPLFSTFGWLLPAEVACPVTCRDVGQPFWLPKGTRQRHIGHLPSTSSSSFFSFSVSVWTN